MESQQDIQPVLVPVMVGQEVEVINHGRGFIAQIVQIIKFPSDNRISLQLVRPDGTEFFLIFSAHAELRASDAVIGDTTC